MDMKRLIIRIQSKIHRNLYQLSKGKIGSHFGAPTLLLTTIGRNSGRPRTTPLFYLQEESYWVVVASNAGADQAPNWWLNLQTNPDAQIQVKDIHHPVHAREATSAEYERLWPQLVAMFSGYEEYQNQTERKTAVVILENQESIQNDE